MKKPLIIIFLVLLIDQTIKFWIKTHMYIGESIKVLGDKFQIYFIENNGMAFGMELGETNYSKLALSLIRIVFVTGIAWYLYKITSSKEKAPNGLIVSLSLIFAGAIGNIIDSMFYGLLFSASPEGTPIVAEFLPAGGGYAPFLRGQVVDMLYFPLFTIEHMPDWIPFIGGERFSFFSAIFNIADSAITIGVLMMLFFQKRYFTSKNVINTKPTTAVEKPETGQNPE
jgi:signal peptidase II